MILLIILFVGIGITYYISEKRKKRKNDIYFILFLIITIFYIFSIPLVNSDSEIRFKEYVYNVERYQQLKQSNDTNCAEFLKLRISNTEKKEDIRKYKNANKWVFDLFIPDKELEKALKARKKFENIKVQKK